ncbi:RNA polymerase sigma factor [Evansella sp. AB-rgal1]|uniref:RNA polymerase sigma factor n=1 Tax=Evansella sp. AB-rgal1 TaxID=3242696 RepID=UPI00359D0A79
MTDKERISEWFHQYSDDVYHFLIYRVGFHEAEDLLQEVYIRAWKNIDLFEWQSNPKTWLLSIARHLAVDEYRIKKKSIWKKMISFESKHETKSVVSPESIFEWNEEKANIYLGIQSLKENYRDVLILRGIQELSVRDTAEALQWSENKVRLTYFRAKDALRKNLERGMYRETSSQG